MLIQHRMIKNNNSIYLIHDLFFWGYKIIIVCFINISSVFYGGIPNIFTIIKVLYDF